MRAFDQYNAMMDQHIARQQQQMYANQLSGILQQTSPDYYRLEQIEQLKRRVAELEKQHVLNGFSADGIVPKLDRPINPLDCKPKLNPLLLLEDCPI